LKLEKNINLVNKQLDKNINIINPIEYELYNIYTKLLNQKLELLNKKYKIYKKIL
jgi:hypothetical protein